MQLLWAFPMKIIFFDGIRIFYTQHVWLESCCMVVKRVSSFFLLWQFLLSLVKLMLAAWVVSSVVRLLRGHQMMEILWARGKCPGRAGVTRVNWANGPWSISDKPPVQFYRLFRTRISLYSESWNKNIPETFHQIKTLSNFVQTLRLQGYLENLQ